MLITEVIDQLADALTDGGASTLSEEEWERTISDDWRFLALIPGEVGMIFMSGCLT